MSQTMKLRGRRSGRAMISAAVFAVASGPAVTALATPPTQYVWSGNGGSGYFTNGANWVGGVPIPTSGNNLIVFGPRNDYGSAPFANGSYGVAGIYFNSSAAAVMVEDLPITIGASGIEDDAVNPEAVLNNLVLSSTQTWEIGNGSTSKLTLSGTQNLSGQTLTMQCNGSSTMTANLIGTGTVYTTGSGTLTLNGSSSFSGTIYTQGAGLVIPGGASLSPSATRVETSGFNLAGGTVNGSATFGYLATGPITAQISSGSWSGTQFDVGFGYGATLTQSGGTLSSTYLDLGAFNAGATLAGSGTFNLSAGTINTAVLAIGSDDADGVLNQTGGTMNASNAFIGGPHNGSATVSGLSSAFNVSGGLTLGVNGGTTTSTLTISNNAYSLVTGQTLLNSSSSTLNISSATFFQTGSLAGVAGSTVLLTNSASNSALNFQPGTAMSGTFRGTISGTGGLFLNSASITENLLGTNTFTGPVTVQGGTLEMATGASTAYQVGGTTLTSTLILDFGNLGTSTLKAGTNGTIVYNTSSVTGGILTGSGTHNVSSVKSFTGTNFASGSTVNLNTTGTSLTNVLIAGTLNATSSGNQVTVHGGFNLASGTLYVPNGFLDVASDTATSPALITSGTLTYAQGNLGFYGPATLIQNGGSQSGVGLQIGLQSVSTDVATFNLSGGTVTELLTFVVGYQGLGILNQTGGTLNSPTVQVGNNTSGDAGRAFVSGATASWNTGTNGIAIGIASDPTTGQLTVSGGAKVVTTGGLGLQSAAASLNISGATVTAASLSGATGATVTLADPTGNYALTINGAGGTYSGNITGTGSLLYSGSGTQVLSGTNSFTGIASVSSGTLNMATGAATTYQASGGTLILGFGSLGASTVRADGNGTVVFNTASVTGGLLAGLNTFNVSAVTSFTNTNISNGTTISTPSGKSLSITNGTNYGNVTLNGTTTLYNWSSAGTGTVNINGPLSIATGNTFNQTAGTVIIAAASTVNVFGTGMINLNGGILENDGTINGPVNVTNDGDLTGTGSFSQITLGSTGGNTGNFYPGSSATGPFDFRFSNITIAPAATVAAEVVSGTIIVTAPAQVSVTSGHSLQFSGIFNASGQQVFFDGGTTKLGSATVGILIVDSGTLQLTSPGQLITNIVNINPGTTSLDVGGSSMVTQTSLQSITNYVKTGYNLSGGANWSGTSGITSSLAAADPSHLTAVGVIGNNQSGSPLYSATHLFHSYAAGINDTLVAYTYFGDANLSGKIDGSDYSLIDAGYASHGSKTGWYYGDFNYDGVVDGSDYALIDNAFNNQSTPINPTVLVATETAQVAGAPAAVPEPAGIASLAILAMVARRGGRTARV